MQRKSAQTNVLELLDKLLGLPNIKEIVPQLLEKPDVQLALSWVMPTDFIATAKKKEAKTIVQEIRGKLEKLQVPEWALELIFQLIEPVILVKQTSKQTTTVPQTMSVTAEQPTPIKPTKPIDTRSIEEINREAIANRRKFKSKMKDKAPPPKEEKEKSLEETYSAPPQSALRDPTLKYHEYRLSKGRNGVDKKQARANIQITQQMQEQQQQQQQQQVQAAPQRKVYVSPKREFEKFKGSKNTLISIQSTKPSRLSEEPVRELRRLHGMEALSYLTQFSGHHESRIGTIGYITSAAADYILRNKPFFGSGITLENLSQGFTLSFLEGGTRTNHDGYYVQSNDPMRLVLDYKKEVSNPHNPLTVRVLEPPKATEMAGSPQQFGMEGEFSFFNFTKHGARNYLNLMTTIHHRKKIFYDNMRRSNPDRAERIIRQLNCAYNQIAQSARGNPQFPDFLLDYPSQTNLSDSTFNSIERILADQANQYKNAFAVERKQFFQFMRAEDNSLAETLISKHEKLFEVMTSEDFQGLWDIFYKGGCEALEVFLQKMQAVFDLENDNTETFFTLKNTFLRYSPNWTEYLTREGLTVFDGLTRLSPVQRHWWNQLSAAHVDTFETWCDLPDLFQAFQYFCREYQETGTDKTGRKIITLPDDFPFLDPKPRNMKVVMERLLTIMKNARNFDEQAANLTGLNLNNNDVVYASNHQHYSLVTRDMRLHEDKMDELDSNSRKKPSSQNPDSNLVFSFLELRNCASDYQVYHSTQQKYSDFCYKYLGTQESSVPYQVYKNALASFKYYPGKYLPDLYQNGLLFLLFTTTTREKSQKVVEEAKARAKYVEPEEIRKKREASEIAEIEQNWTELVAGFDRFMLRNSHFCPDMLNRLGLVVELSVARDPDTGEDRRWMTFPQIAVVARISLLVPIDNYEEWDIMIEDLHAYVFNHREDFLNHLIEYDKNKNRISIKDYLACLKLFDAENGEKKEEKAGEQFKEPTKEELFKIRLFRLFSIINYRDFTLDKAKKLINMVKSYEATNPFAYDQLIGFLSILEVKPEAAYDPPTIDDVIKTVARLTDVTSGSLPQPISEFLPRNCTYNPAKIRLGMKPLLNSELILTELETKATGLAVALDPAILRSEKAVDHIIEKCHEVREAKSNHAQTAPVARGQRRRDLANKYCHLLLNEQLKGHRAALNLHPDKKDDIARLYDIVETVFKPTLPQDLGAQIAPLQKYSEEVKKLIATLAKVRDKWPRNFSDILARINGTPGDSIRRRSMDYLIDFLEQFINRFSKNEPFPLDLLGLLIDYEKQHPINHKHMALGAIFGEKKMTQEHMHALISFNLDWAKKNIDAAYFIKGLVHHYQQFAPVFSDLLSILGKYKDLPPKQIKKLFDRTLFFLKLLADNNNEAFAKQLIAIFVKFPSSYLAIISHIEKIPVPVMEPLKKPEKPVEESSEVKDSPPVQNLAAETADKKEEKKPDVVAPQNPDKRTLITKLIFQFCDPKEFKHQSIVELVDFLAHENEEDLKQLYEMRPPPGLNTLFAIKQKGNCRKFLEDPAHPNFQYRDLKSQFDTSNVISAIRQIQDLLADQPLLPSEQRKLLRDFLLINNYGHNPNYPIFIRETGQQSIALCAKDMTENEIKQEVKRCRKIFQDNTLSAKIRETAYLVFCALSREAKWRTTRKFPNPEQVLARLIVHMRGDQSIVLKMETGEGKSQLQLDTATDLWLQGGAVNIGTSTPQLAREGFDEFSPCLEFQGIPFNKKLVSAQMEVAEYCYDGINYGDIAQLALFIAKQTMDPYYLTHHAKTRFSLVIDEIDFAILDNIMHFLYAVFLHKKDLRWVYPILLKLVNTKEFQETSPDNGAQTIGQDLQKARALLLDEAKKMDASLPDKEKITPYIAALLDRQINTWLESALVSKSFTPEEDFVVREEVRGVDDNAHKISYARILSDFATICEGAEWGNGVHQFVHARLNEEKLSTGLDIPDFPIDPETVPIASISCPDLVEHHQQNGGRVIGLTATPGSPDELKEQQKKFGFAFYSIPRHKPSQLVREPGTLGNDERDLFASVMDKIHAHITRGETQSVQNLFFEPRPAEYPQPILVTCDNIPDSNAFYAYLVTAIQTEARFAKYKNKLRLQLFNSAKTMLNGKPVKMSATEVRIHAGVAGSITVSPGMDRGVDAQARKHLEDRNQNHPQGLHEETLGEPRNTRHRGQREGRAARFGHPGQTSLSSSRKKLLEKGVPPHVMTDLEKGLAYYQKEVGFADQNKRLFAERLGQIKKYFTLHYRDILGQRNAAANLRKKVAKENAEKLALQAEQKAEEPKGDPKIDNKTSVADPNKPVESKTIEAQTASQPKKEAETKSLEAKAPEKTPEKPEPKKTLHLLDEEADTLIKELWSDCLNNMQVEWQQLVPRQRALIQQEKETEKEKKIDGRNRNENG